MESIEYFLRSSGCYILKEDRLIIIIDIIDYYYSDCSVEKVQKHYLNSDALEFGSKFQMGFYAN